ncbi:MAG: hypothetical protein M0R05_01595 [Bacilli bacterium]|nr:hypothetical protein [Bacilli bacterium]MDD4076493.1 hypothetical protein [Bacilli bacterium]MDD4387756.1 hypothetical protein [Bacilli bacterium]
MNGNEHYLEKGKEILRILINNGCEAYIIGDAVCKTILQIPFCEISITTNATPDVIKGIFSYTKITEEGLGAVRLYYSGYEFIVSTFRAANFKDKRNPKRMHYSKSFHEELANRDFTLNAIAMTYGGKLTDAYRGFEDIQKRIIRAIGSPKIRFTEDPLRLLIAIRFVSELGFRIEKKTLRAMRSRSRLLGKLEIPAITKELKRILYGKNIKKALGYLYKTKIYKRIPYLSKDFRKWAESYRLLEPDTFLALAFVRNGRYLQEFEGLAEDQEQLKLLVELALTVSKGKYSQENLFDYGLDVCKKANYINYLLKKDKKRTRKITKEYNRLPLKDVRELALSAADILQLTGNREGDYVQALVDDMAHKVLGNSLSNNFDELRDYALTSLRQSGILPKIDDENIQPDIPLDFDINEETDSITTNQIPENVSPIGISEKDMFVPESKLLELEKKLYEHDRLLQEKDEKIRKLERITLENKLESDIKNLVGQNIELLEDMKYIEKGTEKVMVSRELNELYRRIITNVDPKFRVLNKNNRNEENNED